MHTTRNRLIFPLFALLALLLVACGGNAEPAANNAAGNDEAMAENNNDAMAEHNDGNMNEEMADEAMDEEMADESMDEEMADEVMDEEMATDLPAWQTLPLVNAATGESFTFADFAGKTVFVEPMATWCTNCRRQLNDVQTAQSQLGEDVVFVMLSVETNLTAADMQTYAQNFGYTTFIGSVASVEMLQALAGEFGQSVSNPPSTPHFIIRPDGSFTSLDTGFESADEIVMQIEEAQG